MKITVEMLERKIAEKNNLSKAEAKDALRWTCKAIRDLIENEGCTSIKLPYLFNIEFVARYKERMYDGINQKWIDGGWILFPVIKIGPKTRAKIRNGLLNAIQKEKNKNVPSEIFQAKNSTD